MKIIKLNAIDSTNSFLKDLVLNSDVENLTTVVTKNQTSGRGQTDAKWHSEPFKNLTFSTFVAFSDFKIEHKKYLNFAISLAVYEVLATKNITKLAIKWPNDIMSANQKICGILIENTFIGSTIKNSVIGIGLNVNQTNFPKYLNNTTSLKLETGLHFSLNELLYEILESIKTQIHLLESKKLALLEKKYLKVLYKKNTPTMFKDSQGKIFMGKITDISIDGNLLIELEDETIKEFGIKEVRFL